MNVDLQVKTYAAYVLVSVLMTVWTARTLFKGGRAFLLAAFRNDESLADSVNRLLVVGFYLLNFGFVCMNLRLGIPVTTTGEAVEAVAQKVGYVLFVLGGIHFLNLYVFHRARRATLLEDAPPPVAPDAARALPAA